MGSLGIIVLLTGTLLGQDAPTQQKSLDLPTYESFFRAVSSLAIAPPVDGQTTNLEDALGITVEEAQSLRSIAADCAANIRAIDLAVRPLVQELRFEAIAEEATSGSVSQQYDELNRQRTQMVLVHIEELRTAIGETGFKRIDTFVNARKGNPGSFFGLPPRVVRPSNN
jgi:hypothetical protein